MIKFLLGVEMRRRTRDGYCIASIALILDICTGKSGKRLDMDLSLPTSFCIGKCRPFCLCLLVYDGVDLEGL